MKALQKTNIIESNSDTLNNILYIFNQENESYLQADKIQEWFSQTKPVLEAQPGNILVKIFVKLAELKVFDLKYVIELCKATQSKLPELEYTELSAILHSLQEMKYNKNINFIQAIVTQINSLNYDAIKALPENIWALAKLGFRDEAFLEQWLHLVRPKIKAFTAVDLTKSIQGFASLKYYNDNFIKAWLERAETVFENVELRVLLNNAFYLTVISINNFNVNDLSPLKIKLDSFIVNIMERIDVSLIKSPIEKQQLIQVYLSGLCRVSNEEIIRLSDDIKEATITGSSKIHRKIEGYIKRTYPSYSVTSEHYEQKIASFIDLMIQRGTELEHNVYIEVDGPSHYYINHLPSVEGNIPTYNALTEFRNRLHSLHKINAYLIPYVDVDNNNYHPNLLENLNRFPESYKNSKQIVESLKTEEDITLLQRQPKISGPKGKAAKKKSSKKNNGKKQRPTELNDADDIDQILADFKIQENILSQYGVVQNKYSNIKNKYKSKNLLYIAIKERDINSVEAVLEHYKDDKTKDFASFILHGLEEREKSYDPFELATGLISSYGQENKIYLEISKLLLDYGYKVEITRAFHMKALIYSFGYGDIELFQSFLALFPENDNKKQLMEFFFINCGVLNYVEIANFLLNKNVDINSYYSREALEVLFAAATGAQHNGKIPAYMSIVIDNLNNQVNSNTPNSIEDLLQLTAGGIKDKGENIPQGRGVTALHLSCYVGEENNDIRLFLLNKDANPNTMNGDGFTPLVTSLLQKNQKVALQILDFGPNINLISNKGITAALIAAVHGFCEVIKKMIDFNSVNLDVATQSVVTAYDKSTFLMEGETPLSAAILRGHFELAKDLIKAGVKLNYRVLPTKTGICSPLFYCILKAPALVDILLEYGANVNFGGPTSENRTPLMLAAESSNPSTQKNNAQKLGLLNPQKIYEDTLLAQRQDKIFEKLLWYGADIKAKDKDGDTVMQYAIEPDYVSRHSILITQLEALENRRGFNLELRREQLSKHGVMFDTLPNVQGLSSEMEITIPKPLELFIKFMFGNSFVASHEERKKFFITLPNKYIQDSTEAKNTKTYKETHDNEINLKYTLSAVNLGFKTGDIVLDIAKLYQEPTKASLKQTLVDINNLAGIYYGFNMYSLAIIVDAFLESSYKGDYQEATMQALMSSAFMALPYVLSTGSSYVGIDISIAYGIGLTSYTGYNFAINSYKFVTEYDNPENQLKSAQDYSALYHYLSETPLQTIFDFVELAAEKDLHIEKIQLAGEL